LVAGADGKELGSLDVDGEALGAPDAIGEELAFG
jgi:hypothetical protein